MSPKLTVPWPNQYTVAWPLSKRVRPCSLHVTGEHVPAPSHTLPSGQRLSDAPLPSAAQVEIVLAPSQLTALATQAGATQLATPPTWPQVPPFTAQSCGGNALPEASQRCSTLPAQVALPGAQAAATGSLPV